MREKKGGTDEYGGHTLEEYGVSSDPGSWKFNKKSVLLADRVRPVESCEGQSQEVAEGARP